MRKTMTEMQLDFCLGKAGYLPTDETSLVKEGRFYYDKRRSYP